jgi:hypothetical protein
MILDHYRDYWPQRYPWVQPWDGPLGPREITPEEKEAELQKFKDLVERARKYDKANNEPDCELEEKKKVIQRMADILGVDVSFL